MYKDVKANIEQAGFAIVPGIFSNEELAILGSFVEQADQSGENFRASKGLFAIRQFFKELPGIVPHVLSDRLCTVIREVFGQDYFVVKSIYFDKPEDSNWFVAYHQDLSISVKQKVDVAGYGPWTAKQDQYAVQPPFEILDSNFTVRIHLDDTDGSNGALHVISGSHNSIARPESVDKTTANAAICAVPMGGIMIMKPLLMHASKRSLSNRRRRVIHIEFSNKELPQPLEWSERIDIDAKLF